MDYQNNGLELSRLGLGCSRMSSLSGSDDRCESIATILAALNTGITFINTADFYGCGHNERGSWTKERPKEQRNYSPRFSGGNIDKNLFLVESLREIAVEPACICLDFIQRGRYYTAHWC